MFSVPRGTTTIEPMCSASLCYLPCLIIVYDELPPLFECILG